VKLLETVLAMIALIAACASGAPSPEADKISGASTAGAETAPLPPLPDDPLAVLPAGAQLVLTVDLRALRGSPHFATLRRWIERQTCTAPTTDHFVLDLAERIVLAGMPGGVEADDMRPLALVRTQHAGAGDAAKLLNQHRALVGLPPHHASEQARGRHTYVEADGTAAARLGDHLLVVGDAAQVAAVLATADGKQPAFPHGDAAATLLRDQGWFSTHGLALGGRVSERGARRMARSLSGVGAQGAVAPLERGALGFALDLEAGVHANAQLELPDAATAREAADSLGSTFSRLSLLLRLTGLPAALASPSIHTDGGRLSLDLALAEEDVRTLLERLELLIGSSTPACLQQQAAADDGSRAGKG